MVEIDGKKDFEKMLELREQQEKKKEKEKQRKVTQPLELTKGEMPLTPGLFKELPFFKIEPYLTFFVVAIASVCLSLEAIGIVKGIAVPIAFLLIVFIMTFFLAKWLFFLPTGRKMFFEKALEGGAIQVMIKNPPKDSKVHFSKNDLEIPPATIDRYNKHYEFYTGKPWVKAAEGETFVYSVSELLKGQRDKTGKEYEAILHQTYDTGLLDGIGIALRMKSALKQPTTWLAIATLVLIGISIALGFLELDLLSQIAEQVVPAPK